MTSFSAYLDASVQVISQPQFTKVIFNTESYDVTGSYNIATGEATISADNIYSVSTGTTFQDQQLDSGIMRRSCAFRIMKRTGTVTKQLLYIRHGYYTTASDTFCCNNSFELKAGDVIYVEYLNPNATSTNNVYIQPGTWFSINKY